MQASLSVSKNLRGFLNYLFNVSWLVLSTALSFQTIYECCTVSIWKWLIVTIILTDLCGILRSNEGYCGNVTFSEHRAALTILRFDSPDGGRRTLMVVAYKTNIKSVGDQANVYCTMVTVIDCSEMSYSFDLSQTDASL